MLFCSHWSTWVAYEIENVFRLLFVAFSTAFAALQVHTKLHSYISSISIYSYVRIHTHTLYRLCLHFIVFFVILKCFQYIHLYMLPYRHTTLHMYIQPKIVTNISMCVCLLSKIISLRRYISTLLKCVCLSAIAVALYADMNFLSVCIAHPRHSPHRLQPTVWIFN